MGKRLFVEILPPHAPYLYSQNCVIIGGEEALEGATEVYQGVRADWQEVAFPCLLREVWDGCGCDVRGDCPRGMSSGSGHMT